MSISKLISYQIQTCAVCKNIWEEGELRVILITQNRDIKTRDVAHCVSSLLRKLAMLASDDKIAMLREELRMPRLLVQPFPACYSVRAKWDRRGCKQWPIDSCSVPRYPFHVQYSTVVRVRVCIIPVQYIYSQLTV